MKILVVRIGALGDALHSLPLVNELKRLAPDTEIHWAAGGAVRKFLDGHAAIAAFVPVGKGALGLARAVQQVRGRYDCAIDTQGLLKSAVLARAAASRVIGRGRGFARETPAVLFYSDPVRPTREHIIDQNLELLRPLFPDSDQAQIRYDIPLPPAPAWDLLEERPVLFNIGGGWWTKFWPIENFITLAREIEATLGLAVGIVWGPGEEKIARYIADRSPAVVAPPTTFGELGAMLARARVLISGETGPLHLAVAVGCRTIALLGPTSGGRNGPHGAGPGGHVIVESALACRPCYGRSCADFRCMPAITVGAVFEALANCV